MSANRDNAYSHYEIGRLEIDSVLQILVDLTRQTIGVDNEVLFKGKPRIHYTVCILW